MQELAVPYFWHVSCLLLLTSVCRQCIIKSEVLRRIFNDEKIFGKVLLILVGLALILASAKGYILSIAGTEITAVITSVKIEQASRSNDNDHEYDYNVIVSYIFDVDGKQIYRKLQRQLFHLSESAGGETEG